MCCCGCCCWWWRVADTVVSYLCASSVLLRSVEFNHPLGRQQVASCLNRGRACKLERSTYNTVDLVDNHYAALPSLLLLVAGVP